MGKVRLLLCAALAALLLAGCTDDSSVPKSSSLGTPVSSNAPEPPSTSGPDDPAQVTPADGVTLMYSMSESEIANRLKDSAGRLSRPLAFLSEDRMLLAFSPSEGGVNWYLFDLAAEEMVLLACFPDQNPEISAAWEEEEQIRVISDCGELTFDPAGEPVEMMSGQSDWSQRASPVLGDSFSLRGGQLIHTETDGSETALYTFEEREALGPIAVSPDGTRLAFGVIQYEIMVKQIVVADLSAGRTSVIPVEAAAPWLCWIGDAPCLIEQCEEGELIIRYGTELAEVFRWQAPDPMNWMVGVEPNGKGQAVLALEYLTEEGVWHREASLLAGGADGIEQRPLLSTDDGRIGAFALSQDARYLSLIARNQEGGAAQLLVYVLEDEME